MSNIFGDMREFDFLKKLRERAVSGTSKKGIGDDCAVIPKDSKTDYVITSDLLVEDIDFNLKWSSPKCVGHKALAVSLSDIASMGAKPVFAMTSIGIPQSLWNKKFADKFYKGWFELAEKYGVELIGGDISKTPDKVFVDSIVIGEVQKNEAVLRSGAKPGDFVYVSGELGGAAYGLKLLEKGVKYSHGKYKIEQSLISRQLKPLPKIELGILLNKKTLASSMIDLSDGLSSDLAHICSESKVGAKIYNEAIPLDMSILKLESEITDYTCLLDSALHGGEDFELLFTVPRKKISELEKAAKNHKISRIGEVTKSTGKIELISLGKGIILKPKGFQHF